MKVRILSLMLTLLLSLPLSAAYAASDSVESDITGHWAENQLENWISKGLIKGYEDGSFKPDGSITRAEFMTLVNRSFGLTDKVAVIVKDVDSQRWENEQVAIALHAGYISGYSDGTMRTGNKVTRQEAAVMIANLLKLDTSESAADLSKFTDAARIPAWSKGSIGAVVAKGILSGYNNGTLGYVKFLTRAETIVMLERALGVKVAVAYDQAGVYGPETGHETIVGDVLLNASGVSLRNTTIKGNLTFGEGIGEGEAMIVNVKVDGDTFIRGGGVNSIYIVGSTLGEVEVNKPSGDVRVAIDDQSEIDHIITYSNTTIESTTAAKAKAAVAPKIAKEREVKVLAAAPQRPTAPATPPTGSKSAVWSEYFEQVSQYQKDLLAYSLYISSLPDVTSAGSDTITSVYGNVSDVNVTGNNSQMNVTGAVGTLGNSGDNSQLSVGGGVGNLTDSGSNSQTTIRDFLGDASVSGNNTQLLVGGNTGNITVSGNNSTIELNGPTGEVTIVGSDTQLRVVDANDINLVGNNNTITSSGGIGNLTVGDNSLGNQLGLVDKASDIAKLTPLERASQYPGVSPSNPPNRPVLLTPTPDPTTPATDTIPSMRDVRAVGAKKLEVRFNKSIDPAAISLSVSKNGSSVDFEAVPNNATNAYTLTLAEKLTDGTYIATASYTDSSTVIGSAEVRVENEKIAKISFVNPSDTVAKGTRIGIEVLAQNQYGESMPNLSGFEVTSSGITATIESGRPIVVVDTSSQSLQTGISIIPITVTDTVSQVRVTKNFKLGNVPTASTAGFRGSLRGIDGQEVSQADWSHTYHMNFDLYDQYGHMLLYPLSSGVGPVLTSLNPNSANISVGTLGVAPTGEPGTFSLPITLNPSGPEEGKDYTFTINAGGAPASKTFRVAELSISPLDLINTTVGTWSGVTADTFEAAGVTDVTAHNLAAILEALEEDDSAPWLVTELQEIVDAVNNDPNKQAALNTINAAASATNWTGVNADTFTNAGVTGVNSSNLSAVTAALNVNGSTSRTIAQIQLVIDPIIALASINASAFSNNWSGLTLDTFNKAGVTGVTEENLKSVMYVLYYGMPIGMDYTADGLQSAINSILTSITFALNDINAAAATTPGSDLWEDLWEWISEDQLSLMGLGEVYAWQATPIIEVLQSKGIRAWTIAQLQVEIESTLSAITAAALEEINAAAESGTWTSISVTQLSLIGLVAIDELQMTPIITALQSLGQRVWTIAELQDEIKDILEQL